MEKLNDSELIDKYFDLGMDDCVDCLNSDNCSGGYICPPLKEKILAKLV